MRTAQDKIIWKELEEEAFAPDGESINKEENEEENIYIKFIR